jgi:hypothetical protein
MTVGELIKIIEYKFCIIVEDFNIVKHLLIDTFPEHKIALHRCNSWEELSNEIESYREDVEIYVGRYYEQSHPKWGIHPIHFAKYWDVEVKKIYAGDNGILCIVI